MKRYIWLLGILVFLFGCIGNGGETEDSYLTYETDTFSIDYPEDWNVDEAEGYVSFASKREGQDDPMLDAFEITYWEGDQTFEELEDHEESLMYEGDEITKNEMTEVNGKEALLIETEGIMPGTNTETEYMGLYVKHNGMVYRLGYGYEKDKEEKYMPIFDKMIDSFELK